MSKNPLKNNYVVDLTNLEINIIQVAVFIYIYIVPHYGRYRDNLYPPALS